MNGMRISSIVALLCAGALSGCQSTPPGAPPVSAAMVLSAARQHADMATLTAGRTLFVGRCARCHALPDVAAHSAAEWHGIVAHMAKRSGLKPDQSEAVLSYIIAAQIP
jgi:mono/diheme cytochrome c family protein